MRALHSDGGPIRVFAGGQTIADVREGAVPEADVIREPSIIVKSRGHIDFAFYERPFTHKSELWSYTITSEGVNPKFVYYYLLTKVGELQALARATSVKLPQLGVKDTDQLAVPVPPPQVQDEVVRILDIFTEFEAELEAELEARTRQYAYYRAKSFEFPESVKLRTVLLGDVTTNLDSQRRPVTRSDRTAGRYPYFGANGIQDYVDDYIFDGTFLLVGEDGSVMRSDGTPVLTWASGKIWVNNHAHVLASSQSDVNLRYIYYYLQTQSIRTVVSSDSRPKLTQGQLKRIPLRLPSFEVQQEIVHTLDQFHALVSDPSLGIPAELNARRAQYRYYRDRLLTFNELPDE
jgi:type I restriction enzyme, S subunit